MNQEKENTIMDSMADNVTTSRRSTHMSNLTKKSGIEPDGTRQAKISRTKIKTDIPDVSDNQQKSLRRNSRDFSTEIMTRVTEKKMTNSTAEKTTPSHGTHGPQSTNKSSIVQAQAKRDRLPLKTNYQKNSSPSPPLAAKASGTDKSKSTRNAEPDLATQTKKNLGPQTKNTHRKMQTPNVRDSQQKFSAKHSQYSSDQTMNSMKYGTTTDNIAEKTTSSRRSTYSPKNTKTSSIVPTAKESDSMTLTSNHNQKKNSLPPPPSAAKTYQTDKTRSRRKTESDLAKQTKQSSGTQANNTPRKTQTPDAMDIQQKYPAKQSQNSSNETINLVKENTIKDSKAEIKTPPRQSTHSPKNTKASSIVPTKLKSDSIPFTSTNQKKNSSPPPNATPVTKTFKTDKSTRQKAEPDAVMQTQKPSGPKIQNTQTKTATNTDSQTNSLDGNTGRTGTQTVMKDCIKDEATPSHQSIQRLDNTKDDTSFFTTPRRPPLDRENIKYNPIAADIGESAQGGWKRNLSRKYKKIVHKTDLYEYTNLFYEKDIITEEEMEEVEKEKGNKFERNRRFINIIRQKSFTTYEKFLELLSDEQNWIKNVITEDDSTTKTSKDVKDISQLRRRVFRNYEEIVRETSISYLADDFISEGLLELHDWEKLSNRQSTIDKNRFVIDTLLQRPSHGFDILLRELGQQGFDPLVTKIQMTETDEDIDDIDIELHLINEGIWGKRQMSKPMLEDIKEHRKDKTFFATAAVDAGMNSLMTNPMLIYTGRPGDGKTKNAIEIASRFHKLHPDWMFVKLDNITKWDTIDFSMSTLVLSDDCLGSTNTDGTKLGSVKEHGNHWANIYNTIIRKKVMAILNVRKNILVKNLESLKKYQLFNCSNTIDLTSEQMEIDTSVKRQLLVRHLSQSGISICKRKEEENYESAKPNEAIKISEATIREIVKTDPFLGFPFTCYMFSRERKYTKLGVKCFTNSTDRLSDVIQELYGMESNNSQKIQFCVMVYMLLKGGSINLGYLDRTLFDQITQTFGIHCMQKHIQQCIKELDNVYITKTLDENETFKFKHSAVLESVASCLFEIDEIGVEFLIRNCSDSFINEFVRPKSYTVSEGEKVLILEENEFKYLIERFISSLQANEGIAGYRWWVCHPVLDDKIFVDAIINAIDKDETCKRFVEKNFGLASWAKLNDKNYFERMIKTFHTFKELSPPETK